MLSWWINVSKVKKNKRIFQTFKNTPSFNPLFLSQKTLNPQIPHFTLDFRPCLEIVADGEEDLLANAPFRDGVFVARWEHDVAAARIVVEI